MSTEAMPKNASLRVAPETRDRFMTVADQDFPGLSADQVVQRLLDEHRSALWVKQAQQMRSQDPDAWTEVIDESHSIVQHPASIDEPWDDEEAR